MFIVSFCLLISSFLQLEDQNASKQEYLKVSITRFFTAILLLIFRFCPARFPNTTPLPSLSNPHPSLFSSLPYSFSLFLFLFKSFSSPVPVSISCTPWKRERCQKQRGSSRGSSFWLRGSRCSHILLWSWCPWATRSSHSFSNTEIRVRTTSDFLSNSHLAVLVNTSTIIITLHGTITSISTIAINRPFRMRVKQWLIPKKYRNRRSSTKMNMLTVSSSWIWVNRFRIKDFQGSTSSSLLVAKAVLTNSKINFLLTFLTFSFSHLSRQHQSKIALWFSIPDSALDPSPLGSFQKTFTALEANKKFRKLLFVFKCSFFFRYFRTLLSDSQHNDVRLSAPRRSVLLLCSQPPSS